MLVWSLEFRDTWRLVMRRLDSDKARDVLMEFIGAQGLEPGDKVPSERELAERLGLSRRAVTGAIEELVQSGQLVRKPRSGTYIAYEHGSRYAKAGSLAIAVVMPWLAGQTSGFESTPNPQTPLFRVPFGSESMTLQIMHGVVAAANKHQARIVTYANNSPEEEKEILRQIARENVAGVLIMPRRELTSSFADIVAAGKPLVFVDHYSPDVDADRVVTANKAAAYEAVKHLIALGHRRIAFFTSFSDITSITDREVGYREALRESGIDYDEDIVRGYEAMRGHNWGYDLALEHCTRGADPVTAVFCVDDFSVEKTIAAAARLGLNVPKDIAIAGFFEYLIPESISIPFARVVQDKFEMGQKAAELLLGRISGEVTGELRHIEVPATLVPGD